MESPKINLRGHEIINRRGRKKKNITQSYGYFLRLSIHVFLCNNFLWNCTSSGAKESKKKSVYVNWSQVVDVRSRWRVVASTNHFILKGHKPKRLGITATDLYCCQCQCLTYCTLSCCCKYLLEHQMYIKLLLKTQQMYNSVLVE